jgi:hypothetical protein
MYYTLSIDSVTHYWSTSNHDDLYDLDYPIDIESEIASLLIEK